MTVRELKAKLKGLKGSSQIAIQVVEDGITFAQNLYDVEKGPKEDGDIVWIYVERELQDPVWMCMGYMGA